MFIVILVGLVVADNFGFVVVSGEQQCLQDHLLKGQMMALQVIANSTEFEFTVEQGQKNSEIIETRKNEILIKYTLTMWDNEYLKYCFRVFGSKNAKFDLAYKKGDETVDREQMANKEDLDLIDGYLKQLDRVYNQMRELNQFQKGSNANELFYDIDFVDSLFDNLFFSKVSQSGHSEIERKMIMMIIKYISILVVSGQVLDQLQKCDQGPLCEATPFNAELHITGYSHVDCTQIVNNLLKNTESTYVISEISTFEQCYSVLSDDLKKDIQQLISSNRIEIVNGGWVQNDQASTNYQDIIYNLQLGHQWVYKTFNYTIKTAWNIDSYGHSHTQSAINYLFNMKQQVIERVDVNDILQRVKRGAMGFIYRVSPYNYEVLTHLRFRRHSKPNLAQLNNGFCVQVYNQLREFEQLLAYQKQGSGDILFNFDSIEVQQIVVEFYSVFSCRALKVIWSTPSQFFESLHIDNITYKYGDFLPHFEDGAYYSGIYINDPLIKKTIRWTALQLQALELYGLQNKIELPIPKAISIAQQYITGIAKNMDEVMGQLQSEYELVRGKINHLSLELVAQLKHNKFEHKRIILDCAQNTKCVQEYFLKNRSMKSVIILIYNPQHAQDKRIEIEVPSKNVIVLTVEGEPLPIQEVKSFEANIVLSFKTHFRGYCEEQFVLSFECSTCAPFNEFVVHLDLSEQIQILEKQFEAGEPIEALTWTESIQDVSVEISRQGIDYEFIFTQRNYSVSVLYNYYPQRSAYASKSVMMNDYNNGGLICSFEKMYILKQQSPFQEIIMQCGKIYTLSLYFGESIELRTHMLAHQLTMGDYTMQVTFHHLSEPATAYTDSNGLYPLKREAFKRENYDPLCQDNDQINCNVYPITAYAMLLSDQHNVTILTDRSQGVFSLRSQTIEILLEHLAGDEVQRNNHHFRHLLLFDDECVRCTWNEFQYQNELKRLSNQFHQKQYSYTNGDRRIRLEFKKTILGVMLYAENLQFSPGTELQLNETTVKQILENDQLNFQSSYLSGLPSELGNLTLLPMEIKGFVL